MTALIRDLPRFKDDCDYYESIISKLQPIDETRSKKINTMYQDFRLKVEAVDNSIEDIVSGFVAVGLQHSTYVDELKTIRLKLDKEVKLAEKILR